MTSTKIITYSWLLALGLTSCVFAHLYLKQSNIHQYMELTIQSRAIQRSNDVLARITEWTIRAGEDIVLYVPEVKGIFEQSKSTERVLSEFKGELLNLKREIVQMDADFFTIIKHGLYYDTNDIRLWLPLEYNSTRPVRAVMIDEDHTAQLVQAWQKCLDMLADTAALNHLPDSIRQFHRAVFAPLYTPYDKTTINNTFNQKIFSTLNDTIALQSFLRDLDVVHFDLWTSLLIRELNTIHLEYCIYLNEVLEGCENSALGQTKYLIALSQEAAAQVGKPFRAGVFLNSYSISQNMSAAQMFINDIPIKYDKGVGRFSFTPQTAGTKYFKLEVQYKNLFTNQLHRYEQTYRGEVFER